MGIRSPVYFRTSEFAFLNHAKCSYQKEIAQKIIHVFEIEGLIAMLGFSARGTVFEVVIYSNLINGRAIT